MTDQIEGEGPKKKFFFFFFRNNSEVSHCHAWDDIISLTKFKGMGEISGLILDNLSLV